MIVPRVADCCLVDLVTDDGMLNPVVVSHADPAQEEMLRTFRAGFPLRLSDSGKLAEALATGHPLVCPNVTDDEIRSITRSEEEAAAFRLLRLGAYVVIPLRARERTVGCLYVAYDRARLFRGSDAGLAMAMAERAATALDNARLYTQAQQAREDAEAANAAKDRFLAMLSHELRTPLSPVLHAVTLLEEEPGIPATAREILKTVYRNVQLEARLIDDLLDLARIRNGKLQLQPERVDAHELISRAVEICRPEMVQRQICLNLELKALETRLLADPARIQQIVWNLISNAMKFTPPGGTITVRTADEKDGRLYVEVRDSGRGIPPERLAKIFDAFEQGDRQQTTGLGLGLAICKALAELHRGSIEARSKGWERGSSFLVRLPVALIGNAAAPAAPAGQPAAPATPLHLLLVEDHPDTAAMLRRLLLRRGYEVRSADSVQSGLEAARGYQFDVLVSDIGLPDGTGIDLIRGIIEMRGGTSDFRGIALSGFGMHEDLERSKNAGFSDHLTKPVDFNLLERTLNRIGADLASRTETPA